MKHAFVVLLSAAVFGIGALTAAAPAQAQTLWGAMAFSNAQEKWQGAQDSGSQDEAERASVGWCNDMIPGWADTGSGRGYSPAKDCQVAVAFHSGQCGAFVVGYDLDSEGRVSTTIRSYSWAVDNSLAGAHYAALTRNEGHGPVVKLSFCQD